MFIYNGYNEQVTHYALKTLITSFAQITNIFYLKVY